jgi:hypothetical protein
MGETMAEYQVSYGNKLSKEKNYKRLKNVYKGFMFLYREDIRFQAYGQHLLQMYHQCRSCKSKWFP